MQTEMKTEGSVGFLKGKVLPTLRQNAIKTIPTNNKVGAAAKTGNRKAECKPSSTVAVAYFRSL